MRNQKKLYHLLHTAKPLRIKEADRGDLKWLGAIVENIDDPADNVDFRPSEYPLIEDTNWSSIELRDFEVSVMKKASMSLQLKLANTLDINIESNGEFSKTAAKKKVVAYTLMGYDKFLNKLLGINGYRTELLPHLSAWSTARWFVTGYLVAIPVESENEKEGEKEGEGENGNSETKDNEPSHDTDETAHPGGTTTTDKTTKVEVGVDPGAALVPAGGALPQVLVKGTIGHDAHAVVKAEAVESHIFAVAFKGIKKEKRGKGVILGDGPQKEGDFGDGPGGNQQQQAAEEVESILLDPTPLNEVLNAILIEGGDGGGEIDQFYATEAVEDLEFAKEEAAKFEELFGGVEFVYKESL
ncbi:uncharacterized protein PAC_10618 [Phialocephala subalpina]|uniref:Uncharacterized protein n=1 Tax=Phialocephala subalpina TaxID=576137 RepID=A0A1L7X6U5_9HELO|nr:uncharacterized protein PAC_10618 [Phialocephala subalpina]